MSGLLSIIVINIVFIVATDASSSERVGETEEAVQRQLTDDGSDDSDDEYQDTSPYL